MCGAWGRASVKSGAANQRSLNMSTPSIAKSRNLKTAASKKRNVTSSATARRKVTSAAATAKVPPKSDEPKVERVTKQERLLTDKGFSLDKLAKLTDSSKSYLWELENRDTRRPSGEKLTRIADALSVTTDYLLDESAEPNENVLREAFFRKFNKLDPNDQKKIEQMIDAWRKKS